MGRVAGEGVGVVVGAADADGVLEPVGLVVGRAATGESDVRTRSIAATSSPDTTNASSMASTRPVGGTSWRGSFKSPQVPGWLDCQRPRSVPRSKTLTLVLPGGQTALGPKVQFPPKRCHALQVPL
jgi:hypothetical protein